MNPKNSPYDIIIYDCDGTIVDSEKVFSKAVSEVLVSIGHPEFTVEKCVDVFTGFSLPSMIEYLDQKFKTQHTSHEIMQMFNARNHELANAHLAPIDYAHELIEQVKLKKCVASNGERNTVLNSLKLTKLDKFFPDNNVFTYEQVKIGKPAPDLFLYAAMKMECLPEKCIVIEDSVVGIKAAKAAGMKVIAFTGASHNNAYTLQHVHDAKPDHIVKHLSEVMQYIAP